MPQIVHMEQGHRTAFTRSDGLVAASCGKRAADRLMRRIMPPVARLEVAKAVHQSALSPTLCYGTAQIRTLTRPDLVVVVSCDERATDRLRPKGMPPMAWCR